MKLKHLYVAVSLAFAVSTPCFAEGDTCSQSCDEGKVLVSFGDGNQSTCLCVEQGSPMEPSVEAISTGCFDHEDNGSCAAS